MVRLLVLSAAISALILPSTATAASTDYGKGMFNVLPPGQAGAFPLTKHSADQIPLYDGLTPLFDQVTAADIPKYYKPETFGVTDAILYGPTPGGGADDRFFIAVPEGTMPNGGIASTFSSGPYGATSLIVILPVASSVVMPEMFLALPLS